MCCKDVVLLLNNVFRQNQYDTSTVIHSEIMMVISDNAIKT